MKFGTGPLTIVTCGVIMAPMNRSRERAFLAKLWEMQAEAGLSDAALARDMGVSHSHVSRAKHDPTRVFGVKFLLGACDRFPELAFFLSRDIPDGIGTMTNGTGKGAA